MNYFVTGANGFVGSAVCNRLFEEGHKVVAPCRSPARIPHHHSFLSFAIKDMQDDNDWIPWLSDIDTAIHLAARVHIMHDSSGDPLLEYRKVNVDGTMALARQAVDAGVRRFIYISSIKVNGEETLPGRPFSPDDTPAPVDPYSVSKSEAEAALLDLAKSSNMEIVIIRPPLVYGPEVKANFLTMMRWLKRGLPLPLGAINNKRSFVALDNLVDLIITCIDHPKAANQIFLVSDGEDLSTTELIIRLANALSVPERLLPVPEIILKAMAFVAGKSAISRRLCGTLQVDIQKNRELLEWEPPFSVDSSLRMTANAFLKNYDK